MSAYYSVSEKKKTKYVTVKNAKSIEQRILNWDVCISAQVYIQWAKSRIYRVQG